MFKQFFNQIFESTYLRWLTFLYIIIVASIAGTIYVREKASLPGMYSAVEIDRISSEIKTLYTGIMSHEAKIDKIKSQGEKLEKAFGSGTGGSSTASSSLDLKLQMNNITSKMENFEQRLDDLSGALNPTTPKEVLTLVRLGDKTKELNNSLARIQSDLDGLRKDVLDEVAKNQQQVTKEIDRVIDLFQWLGLILIPIVLNTLKDIIKPNADKTSNG